MHPILFSLSFHFFFAAAVCQASALPAPPSSPSPDGVPRITLEVAALEFCKSTSHSTPIYDLPIEEGRAEARKLQAESVAYTDGITSEWQANNLIRLVRPVVTKAKSSSCLPVIVYLHGGGWTYGSTYTHGRLIGELAKSTQAAVAAVEFSQSPEVKFPTALDESFAALEWVRSNWNEQAFCPDQTALAGDSVGGNMAAVTSIRAAKEGIHLVGQVLLYPATDLAFTTTSYQQFGQGYGVTTRAMQATYSLYLDDVQSQANDPRVSPLRACLDQIAFSPPSLVITVEADVLRDEGEAYAARLSKAGVQTRAQRFPANIHNFILLDALKDTEAAKGAMELASRTLRDWFATQEGNGTQS